ncbi:YraN family protein [Candidatus Peregrinibacteria bacterium]|nr:YraN family protein [Candidatus Peregrinibacteria bacterium]
MESTSHVGIRGEAIASAHLTKIGYVILAKNVRMGHDEIDIVALDPKDDVIVFAEVKSRARRDRHYWPAMNMTWEKKRCMRRAARRWIAKASEERGYRLDLLCVAEGQVVDHLINVGWHDHQ